MAFKHEDVMNFAGPEADWRRDKSILSASSITSEVGTAYLMILI